MSATADRVRRARGLSLVEATISLAIVGLMLVAALQPIGTSAQMQLRQGQRETAVRLAGDLMREIVSKAYEDPDNKTPVYGLDPEEGGADRADFDDVDDYHGWTGDPPVRRDGTTIAAAADYVREVEVVWLDPNDMLSAVGSESGAKGIRVRVLRRGIPMATIRAVRASVVPDPVSTKGRK